MSFAGFGLAARWVDFAFNDLDVIGLAPVRMPAEQDWRRELETSCEAGELLPLSGVLSAALPTESGQQKNRLAVGDGYRSQ
jgi:hypothetical protein